MEQLVFSQTYIQYSTVMFGGGKYQDFHLDITPGSAAVTFQHDFEDRPMLI